MMKKKKKKLFYLAYKNYSVIHLYGLVRLIVYYLRLSLLPSIYPVSVGFSKFLFLRTCATKFDFLIVMLSVIILFVSIFCKTFSFLTYYSEHSSTESNFCCFHQTDLWLSGFPRPLPHYVHHKFRLPLPDVKYKIPFYFYSLRNLVVTNVFDT